MTRATTRLVLVAGALLLSVPAYGQAGDQPADRVSFQQSEVVLDVADERVAPLHPGQRRLLRARSVTAPTEGVLGDGRAVRPTIPTRERSCER